MTDASRKPDAGELRSQPTAEAKFPGAGGSDFRVYFTPEVHENIWRHAREDTSVEVGGVLVGQWHHDADGPFVLVSQFIRCDAAASRSGEVTFTHEAWSVVNREMDTRFADLRIVGWYHTHPRFGVFLSDRDVFIHEHFFSNPGQIALVVDPVAQTEGVFAWREGKPALWPHYWVGQEIYAGAEEPDDAAPQRPDAERMPPSYAQPDQVLPLLAMARYAMLYLLLFLVGYLLGGLRSAWERERLIEGTVAHYGIWKVLRPGLRQELDRATSNLDAIYAAVDQLAKRHVELAGDQAAETKAIWNEVRGAMRDTRRWLVDINGLYSLSPEEELVVARLIAAKQAELRRPKDAEEPTKPGGEPSGEGAGGEEPRKPASEPGPLTPGPSPEKGEGSREAPSKPASDGASHKSDAAPRKLQEPSSRGK